MSAAKMLGLVFACVVLLNTQSTTLAQNSPQDYVDAHNAARSAVGVANITWNKTIQTFAESYADLRKVDCNLTIPTATGSLYGSILSNSNNTDFSGTDFVNSWVSYKQYYDYDSNTCASGKELECRAYEQVVWRNSTQLGCGRAECDNNAGVFVICSYYPPGNVPGEKPY